MTCYAKSMMMSEFHQSILNDAQLQDEIAKTFLYAGSLSKDHQEKVNPRFQQHDALIAPSIANQGQQASKIKAHDGFDFSDPLLLDKKRASIFEEVGPSKPLKKQRIEAKSTINFDMNEQIQDQPEEQPATVPPSKYGITIFGDNDVLSGRGGGTNVHPGNRNFRDLINLHRRAYLKAKKNDKPGISRAIVRSVREAAGRFLKKNEKTGLWYEIGDTAAREKTSQALRQRAPEMRRLMFETEQEEARHHQLLISGFGGMVNPGMAGYAIQNAAALEGDDTAATASRAQSQASHFALQFFKEGV